MEDIRRAEPEECDVARDLYADVRLQMPRDRYTAGKVLGTYKAGETVFYEDTGTVVEMFELVF